jgi:hypothetical protein
MQIKLITLTDGSIKNSYLRTTTLLDLLPADAIGGANMANAAARTIAVDFGGGTVIQSDVDGTKHILRDRKGMRAFLKRFKLQAGQQICVTQTGPYAFRVDPS